MSDKIKPSEVSEVLFKELEGINSGVQMALHVFMDFVMLKPVNFLSLKMVQWPL